MDNINISYEFFSLIKIISEELIKYIKNFSQISTEHLARLQSLNNLLSIKLTKKEEKKVNQVINLTKKIKEVIKHNIDLMSCSIEEMNSYIITFENNIKSKTELINELKKSSSFLTNDLTSSYQEVNKTGYDFITSLEKTEDIIDTYYINKIKIRDHENGLGNRLNNNEYNLIKEQQKNQLNEMNNAIKLSKKYEEFHKGAIQASDKIYNEFIESYKFHKNKITQNVIQISNKIKEIILFFFSCYKSVYNQPFNLIEEYIKELNEIDEIKEMNNILEQNFKKNNLLKKAQPIKYKLKSLKLLQEINYIKNKDKKEEKDDIFKMNFEEENLTINRKIVKGLDDNFNKLYYISDDALMLTIKEIFNNYDLIEKENFDITYEEKKNKTQRYIMKIIENINSLDTKKRIELSNVELTDLINLLNEHDNRIIFLQKLSDYRVKGKYILPEKDFIILAQIFNILCEKIKINNDYRTAELLIIISQTYYTLINKEKKYLQNSFKENELFKDKNFWEEYLCYSINKEIMKMLKQEKNIKEDKEITDYKYGNIVFTQILTIIETMFEFDLKSDIIKEVLEPKINYYRLNDEFKETINEIIKNKEDNLKIKDNNNND